MNNIVKADAEFVIWLIVGVFWVIAQIAGAAGRKKAPPRPPSDQEGEGAASDDPFAELMRKLSGVQEFKIPKPPEPEPIVDAVSPPRPLQHDAVRTPHLRSPEPEPVAVPEVDIRPTMQSFKTVMPSMKLPAMSLRFQGLEKSAGGFPKVENIIDPSDKQTLRRAILGHVILGKPKALEGWSTGTVE